MSRRIMPLDERPNKKKKFIDLDMLPGNAPRPEPRSRGVRVYATSTGAVEAIKPDGSMSLLGGGAFVRARHETAVELAHSGDYVTPTNITEITDLGGDFASGVFTAPRSSVYSIEAKVLQTDATEGEYMSIYASRNNSTTVPDLLHLSSGIADVDGVASVYLEAGDTIRLKLSCDGGGTVSIQVTHFAVIEI